jgi:hypothetical protein
MTLCTGVPSCEGEVGDIPLRALHSNPFGFQLFDRDFRGATLDPHIDSIALEQRLTDSVVSGPVASRQILKVAVKQMRNQPVVLSVVLVPPKTVTRGRTP